jgi:hypothetical protein
MGGMTRVVSVQNPPFNLPDCPVVRLAWRTLAEAHLEHSKQADDIKQRHGSRSGVYSRCLGW